MELTRVTTRYEYGDTSAKFRVWAIPGFGTSEYYYVDSVEAALAVFDENENFDGYMAAGLEQDANHELELTAPDWSEWYDEATGANIDEYRNEREEGN